MPLRREELYPPNGAIWCTFLCHLQGGHLLVLQMYVCGGVFVCVEVSVDLFVFAITLSYEGHFNETYI